MRRCLLIAPLIVTLCARALSTDCEAGAADAMKVCPAADAAGIGPKPTPPNPPTSSRLAA